jgi:hypothetical protein
VQLWHNKALNHVHLQIKGLPSMVNLPEGYELYDDLPLGHSNTCPNRRFLQNCLKAGLKRIPYSENTQRFAVCVAIQDRSGRLLLTRRASFMRKFPNCWVIPGGHVDLDEGFE